MKQSVNIGQVDYTVLVFIPDPASTDGSGKTGLVAADLTVSGTRVETDNDVTVIDYTSSLNNLGGLTTAHTDWGVLEVSSTLAPGVYRLDIADAIFATGAWSAVVYVMITTSAAAASPMEFMLNIAAGSTGGVPVIGTGTNNFKSNASAEVSADVTKWLGTAASTPTVAGVPNVNVKTWNDLTTVALPLIPTTAGRTLDVSAGGEAGVDWANVGSPTTTLGLTNTTVGIVTLTGTLTTYTGNTVQTGDSFARIGATGSGLTTLATQASVNTIDDFLDTELAALITTVGAAGAGLTAINLPDQTMNITGDITGNLSGSVGSVTGAVTLPTIPTAWITADGIAANAIGASELAADAATEIATAVLTTAMTESYAANGAAPTLAQAQFAIHQMLMDFGISGTTLTVLKLDNSTTAFVVTLSDATNPVAAART